MIPPNRLIDSIWRTSQQLVRQVFGIVRDSLREFWSSVDAEDPMMMNMVEILGPVEGWRDTMVPYVLHGDGAKFAEKNQQHIMSVQWKPALFVREVFDTWFVIWTHVKSATVHDRENANENACGRFWKYTVHFLNACFDGYHPALGPWGEAWAQGTDDANVAGSEMCGGYRFVCWCIMGDLDYLSNDLQFPHYGANRPCWFCSRGREEDSSFPMHDFPGMQHGGTRCYLLKRA